MQNLHYLTVQDILWINLQATKKVQHFNFAKLEEATFYQYSYGESSGLLLQAGRFLTGFLRLHPFEAGNESTALIGTAAFLRLNGSSLEVTDEQALDWLDSVMTKQVSGTDAVARAANAGGSHHEGQPDVRGSIKRVLEQFPNSLANLCNRSATAK